MKRVNQLILIFIMLMLLLGCAEEHYFDNDLNIDFASLNETETFNKANYKVLEVEGGNLSGEREANVVVNIGFGDREYYAYTNEYGQLVRVEAAVIQLQDESVEPVNKDGRYFPDEAKVPGVEHKDLDEGHVIADSLGGVANAYNITPQDSTINRHGDQAYLEKAIREAGGCTDFLAIITYSNTKTQIPNHYNISYVINGEKVVDAFDNVNPEEKTVHSSLKDTVKITALDKRAEWVEIKNETNDSINMTGWKIVSVRGNQTFVFPEYVLDSGKVIRVGDSGKNSDVAFHWLDGSGVWSNSNSDPAELYDSEEYLVNRLDD